MGFGATSYTYENPYELWRTANIARRFPPLAARPVSNREGPGQFLGSYTMNWVLTTTLSSD